MTRVAVVGHVEWVEFVQVERFPARGAIVAAPDTFTRAGGGAVVAAHALLELGAQVDFFGALGRDADGEAALAELTGSGLETQIAWRPAPTRRVLTLLEIGGERTIITLGERLAPEGSDPLDWARIATTAGVYFTAGDGAAAARTRAAPVLVTTPRAYGAFTESRVPIDALVFSAGDAGERSRASELEPLARLMVATEGKRGGHWWGESEGRWEATELPGPQQDDYGCGDAFAAGFTFGLATGRSVAEAARLGAERGAWALTQVGPP
jgi:ribokinase